MMHTFEIASSIGLLLRLQQLVYEISCFTHSCKLARHAIFVMTLAKCLGRKSKPMTEVAVFTIGRRHSM